MDYRPRGWKAAKAKVIGQVTEGCYECADRLIENAIDAFLERLRTDNHKLTPKDVGKYYFLPDLVHGRNKQGKFVKRSR